MLIINNQFKKVVGFATHNTTHTYGCSVPRLTRFVPDACMGPDPKKIKSQKSKIKNKGPPLAEIFLFVFFRFPTKVAVYTKSFGFPQKTFRVCCFLAYNCCSVRERHIKDVFQDETSTGVQS